MCVQMLKVKCGTSDWVGPIPVTVCLCACACHSLIH